MLVISSITMDERSWVVPTVTLCTYGFFKEMKPSEPFLTPYLNSSYKHLSAKDLSDQVYPISTYSYFVFLFLVFLFTDFLRYKPLIILESLAYLSTRFILVWGDGIPIMQLMQVTYGLAEATEIAYYSYIYAMVDERYYQKVTSYSRAVTLLGRGTADILGQILISTKAANYLVLNYISLGTVSFAVVVSFFLPKVNNNVFALDGNSYQELQNESEPLISSEIPENIQQNDLTTEETSSHTCYVQWKLALKRMFVAFKSSYSNKQLLMWSIWWAFAMCGGLQVENYVMNLWSDITGSNTKKVYNGAVFACGTLLSALIVFLFSLVKIQWTVVAEILIGVISLLDTVLLLTMAFTNNIWIAYLCYVIFRASYAFVLTVASFQIALHVEMKSYALIFGWNTFIALCMQSLLTLIVADKRGLDLDERSQFIIYGGYFGAIAFAFIARPFCVLVTKIARHCCSSEQSMTMTSSTNETI